MTYLVYGPTNAAGSLKEALVKEDVSDLITNLFPLDTPLTQVLSKTPMNNVFTEQPVDFYSTGVNSGIVRTNAGIAINTGNADPEGTFLQKPEGHTFTTSTPFYPARLKSVAEIQGIQFAVSDTDRAMSQYGIGDRYTYEALKTTRSVVNNFETSFWWSLGTPPEGVDADSDSGSAEITTIRNTQGLMPWILFSGLQRTKIGLAQATHIDGNGNEFGTNSAALNGSSSHAYDAAGLTLDQSMFKEQLMSPWWTNTGRTGGAVGFAGPKVKGLFSQFALTANGPVNERTLDAASKLVVDTVDYYETDFGLVSINLCRYLGIESQSTVVDQTTGTTTVAWDESLVFIHPEYWNIGVVRGVTFTPLAKTGDFESGLVRGEQSLICRNPMAGAAIVNCIP